MHKQSVLNNTLQACIPLMVAVTIGFIGEHKAGAWLLPFAALPVVAYCSTHKHNKVWDNN